MLVLGLLSALHGPSQDLFAASQPVTIERAVVSTINAVRGSPSSFVPVLARYRQSFEGKVALSSDPEGGELTQEGPKAVDEALVYLRSMSARGELAWDDGLARLARQHAEDQNATGIVGHEAADGSDFDDRVTRYAGPRSVVWEIISYGERAQDDVVRQFIVDDGEIDRGHREGLFDSSVTRVGVACRPHPLYSVSCVVELASR